jgi:Flp pilus assembly protein TadG
MEMAFVLPVIFVFILLLVDFGTALDRREVLQHAVREGARRGAVTTSISEIVNTTVAQSQGLLEADDVTVCYTDMNGNGRRGDPGDSVKVGADYTYRFSVGGGELLSAFFVEVPTIEMDPWADMRLENSVSGAPQCS